MAFSCLRPLPLRDGRIDIAFRVRFAHLADGIPAGSNNQDKIVAECFAAVGNDGLWYGFAIDEQW